MTEEQIKALVAEAAKAAAVDAAKATAAELTAVYDAKLETQRADFAKQLATVKPAAGEGKPTGKPNEVTPELAALQESNAALLKKFEESEARGAAIAKAAREKETNAAISRLLQANGVMPETMPAVEALLKTHLVEAEDGTFKISGRHPTTGLAGEFSIEDGVKTWAASPEALPFKAPRGIQGDGSRPGSAVNTKPRQFADADDLFKTN